MRQMLQPAGWSRPVGYANGIAAEGRLVVVAGQVGWNAQQQFESDDFVEQARRALSNVVAVLREGGALPVDVVRLTWYVLDLAEYRAARSEVGRAYREVFGSTYPAMTLVQVAGLLEERARLEIEATAVVAPEG